MRHKRLRSLWFLLGLAVLAAGAAFSHTPPASGTSCRRYNLTLRFSGATEDGVPTTIDTQRARVSLSGKSDGVGLLAIFDNPNAVWREEFHVASVATCP
jgi:hypothetical protein